MNSKIIEEISKELVISIKQVEATLKLLEEGNTIPFIARYRKEVTGALDEEKIRKIEEVYTYQVNLLKRKEDVIRLIDEKGLMTDELKNSIMACEKLVEVEDLYRPFKEKKKTKASEAIKAELEPLAKKVLSFVEFDLYKEAESYLNDMVKTVDKAIEGVKYIIAEIISDDARYRKFLRNYIYLNGEISSKKKKNATDESGTYKNYYDYKEKIKTIKSHRVLALNRGEKEDVLSVSLNYSKDDVYAYLKRKVIVNENVSYKNIIEEAIVDSANRLILPSIEREIRSDLTDKAEVVAIENFAKNLEALLMTPPLKEKMVLALDPAYRTGCKLAVLDKNGNPLKIEVIYPTPPMNKILESKKIVLNILSEYKIDVVAIGNGTASRESEKFIADVIKEADHPVSYVMVNEAGASVYSASELGIKEFPDLTVEKRSAISIGRRLQDSLSELVKIDPKNIGVGLYQHDVKEKELSEALDFTVTKAVNKVGVDLNTASVSLLKYISGLSKKSIDAIINYRLTKGKINSREELRKINGISAKAFEQSAGFLRINNGSNQLDETAIHPDNYSDALNILKKINMNITNIGTEEMIYKLGSIDLEDIRNELQIEKYTFYDIIDALKKPHRDPRDEAPKPILKSDVLTIDDVVMGMELTGTVRNVVDFGIFVDVGLHNDALAHISKLSKDFVRHPSKLFKVGDIVTCYVIGIDKKNEKISISLLKEDKI